MQFTCLWPDTHPGGASRAITDKAGLAPMRGVTHHSLTSQREHFAFIRRAHTERIIRGGIFPHTNQPWSAWEAQLAPARAPFLPQRDAGHGRGIQRPFQPVSQVSAQRSTQKKCGKRRDCHHGQRHGCHAAPHQDINQTGRFREFHMRKAYQNACVPSRQNKTSSGAALQNAEGRRSWKDVRVKGSLR